jgi:hypothetical protein
MLHFDGPCDDQLMACPVAQWLITFEKHPYKFKPKTLFSCSKSIQNMFTLPRGCCNKFERCVEHRN